MWSMDDGVMDPEEAKVIFCALDSFRYQSPAPEPLPQLVV